MALAEREYPPHRADPDLDRQVADAVAGARDALGAYQAADGHFVFELEADATIPSEYIFLRHYLAEPVDGALEHKIAVYLRRIQGADGGWPLFYGGEMDLSASVKAYYALKIIGDDIEAPHMRRARDAILARGGAARANVFTRIALALFGQVPWRAVPVMPVEIMHLPRWFPFHLDKISYWSRTVIVPLLVLMALKPRARNPKGVAIAELFVTPADRERRYNRGATRAWLAEVFLGLDWMLRKAEPFMPKGPRRRAIDKAVAWTTQRLNGEDGLGAIFPAMANAVMAFDALGYSHDHSDYVTARRSIEKLLVVKDDEAYCQPCVSPIWDTALAAHSLMEAGIDGDDPSIRRAVDWLRGRQILDVAGDWAVKNPSLRPGGWAFQYRNDHYPDVDDTAVVGMAIHRAEHGAAGEATERAIEWIRGMQSANGGWGAFDIDNAHYALNHIPFADHGALLDPPTEDVTARCLSFLAQAGVRSGDPAVRRGIDYLKSTQCDDGSWFGRWGTNYVYGTWSVLSALNAVGEDLGAPYIRRAVEWLKSRQHEDGGWGEAGTTYWENRRSETAESTPSQTAWALLGLMAAGEVASPAVRRGVAHLLAAPRDGHKWHEEMFTAVGFPRVFYLRYHGYSAYFPLWALARYRNLLGANQATTAYGI